MARSRTKSTRSAHLTKCKGCNIKFMPKDKRQKFHSPECRVRYYVEHYGSPVVTKTCPNCGTSFSTAMPKKQTYCKPECREEARLNRQDKLRARVTAEKKTFLSERYAAFQRDGFKCVFCGRGPEQGTILDVVEVEHELKTTCLECKAGKEFLGEG